MLTALGTGFVLGLSAGIAPGPMLTLVITQTLKYGVREGLKVALAPLITDFPIILATLIVVSSLAAFDLYLGLISLAGGCYVLVLAAECIRAGRTDIASSSEKPRSLKKAITLNFLNPHPYIFWITIGSPLMLKYGGVRTEYAVVFIVAFYALLVGSKMALAVIVGRSRHVLTGTWYVFIMRILGAILIAFSLLLFRDAFRYLFK